ncbi:MAG: hypothetical protein J1E03_01200 [Acetatifactor sp.]|nr:hypothetical protein [Acetatifactor sp.]
MNIFKSNLTKVNIQNIIVALGFFAVCVATQQMQTVSLNTGIIDLSRDITGIVMALILMTHYKWSDIIKYKIPYILWSVLGIVLGIIFTPMVIVERGEYRTADTIIISVGIFLIGYCFIYTGINIFINKYRPRFYLPLFVIWIVMLILMIFSRSDNLWPECYFILFLSFYLTEQTPEQRTNVIKGMLNGIVLAFVVIQAHALLCRPYDRVRYCGNFCNPNNNAIFLCICLSAIFSKILFLIKENGKKVVKVFYFLLAGVCYSFIFMTASRSGYLTVFIVTIFFLLAYCRVTEKKVFIKMGALLVLIFVTLMPITYLAVRYIPTIHPHVLFYFQEGYSEQRVHSWDDRNSSKYITFTELMNSVLGRFGAANPQQDALNEEKTTEAELASRPIESVNDDFSDAVPSENETKVEILETDPDKIPVLSDEEAKSAIKVRYTIYKWYFTHLSLRGMPNDEQGFQLAKGYWVGHAHDIYLDYGINYGYPVMILFIIFIWWGIGRLAKYGLRIQSAEKLSCLLIALVSPIFGLFEFAWGAGMISTVALYFTFREMFNN